MWPQKSIIESLNKYPGPYLIELWDCVWDFLRHLNICFCTVIKTSHHGGTQGDLFVKKMKVAMDTTQKNLNPDMDRPRLKKNL